MINSVRNTVMAVLNKHNYGYVTPMDFNLYAKQAQLEIFENYFFQYNSLFTKQNSRLSGSGYADKVGDVQDIIDIFSEDSEDISKTGTKFLLPEDLFFLSGVTCNNIPADRVTWQDIQYLLHSDKTSPSVLFPVYIKKGGGIVVFPSTIESGVSLQYIRKPLDPKWTYTDMLGGEPLFDQSAADYKDFEIPAREEPMLVDKILQYAGLSIREMAVVSKAAKDEVTERQVNDL